MDKASILRAYSAVLHKERQLSALQGAGEDFWFKHGDRPAGADFVYQAHVDRVAGRGSPALCDEAVARAIREI